MILLGLESLYPEKDYIERLKNEKPVMLIANHISIFDPMFIGSTQFCPSFVAKYCNKGKIFFLSFTVCGEKNANCRERSKNCLMYICKKRIG